ncbi:MAG TPA: FAD:protein FMN transferase [Planctomycetota bacterium]|nr:FAD:protein FMN transferase [Planctomycetota bacterium]
MNFRPLLLLLLLFTGCGAPKQTAPQFNSASQLKPPLPELPSMEWSGRAFGTTYSIVITSPPPAVKQDDLSAAAEKILQRIDKQISSYRDDSEISTFSAARSTEWFAVSPEVVTLVEEARSISEKTGGAFDITVAPLVRLWKFGKSRDALVTPALPSDDAVNQARQKVGYTKLETRRDPPALRKSDPELSVDLSAIGEGHAVDAIGDAFEALGISNYLIELGGEIRARGQSPHGRAWRAGIERPSLLERELECAVELKDMDLATSGNYRNYYEVNGTRYSHIIDARTGRPVEHTLAAVSVIAPRTTYADALATAMMIIGPQDAMALATREKVAALLIVRKGDGFEVRATPESEAIRVKD